MMLSFVYITISGLMFVASTKTYKLKLLYILNEKAENLKLKQTFFKIKYGIFRLKKVENIIILSFIAKTKKTN